MANTAFPTRPLKQPRASQEPKATASPASINGFVEPPLSYVPSKTVPPIKPTLSDEGPVKGAKTTIVSRRYRNKCGDPIFTVRIERNDRPDVEETEVEFDDIEDYVSKAELERFESTWYDPDEVMPGIVIGAPGFEKTQTWERPSSTNQSDDGGSNTSRKKAKKAATREFVDTLPPLRKRGRTAAIMGVGPAVNTTDGHQSEEEAYEFDADIEDEVDPANVRGTGGFVLIPSPGSAVSSQANTGARVQRPTSMPTMPERSSSASGDKSDEQEPDKLLMGFQSHRAREQDSASDDQEPDELLIGFNPRRTQERETSARAPSYASQPRRGPGRPRQSAERASGSLLEYVESNHGANNTIRKSSMHQSSSPSFANMPAGKAVHGDVEEGDAASNDTMPAAHESIERPLSPAQADRPAQPVREVEIIEISSGSESDLSGPEDPYHFLTPAQRQQLAEIEQRGLDLRAERAEVLARRAKALQAQEEEHRKNLEAEEREKMLQEEERQRTLQEEDRARALRVQERERTFAQWAEHQAKANQQPPAPARVSVRKPSREVTRAPVTLRRLGSPVAARDPATTRPSFRRGPQALAPIAPGASADNAICIDDDEAGNTRNTHGGPSHDANDNYQAGRPPPPDDDDDDNSSITHSERAFPFHSVIDHKLEENGTFVYLVKWDERPHPPEDESWFPEDELGVAAKIIIRNYLRDLRRPASPDTMRNPQVLLDVRPRWRLLQERARA